MSNENTAVLKGMTTFSKIDDAMNEVAAELGNDTSVEYDGASMWNLKSPHLVSPQRIYWNGARKMDWYTSYDLFTEWFANFFMAKVSKKLNVGYWTSENIEGEKFPVDFDVRYPTYKKYVIRMNGLMFGSLVAMGDERTKLF